MIESVSYERVAGIGDRFALEGTISAVRPYGDGHINSTYKVDCKTDEGEKAYILQKINTSVFTKPEKLMANIVSVTGYLGEQKEELSDPYEVLELVWTRAGSAYFHDEDGSYWRMYVFVENSISYTSDAPEEILYEAGLAVGDFQRLLTNYPAKDLHETIEDFHHTGKRYGHLLAAYNEDCVGRAADVDLEMTFCEKMTACHGLLTDALSSGDLPYRVTHNDTKINNVLMDSRTGRGLCVIDLDTVMPGTSLFDFGDAIRSSGTRAAEDETDMEKITFELSRFKAFTKGYLESAGTSLTAKELDLLPYGAVLMTYECGVRFLTDYLNGDVYFKVQREGQNLDRARNQFKLTADMLANLNSMKEIISRYRTK